MSQWTEWQLQKFQILFEKYAKRKKDHTNNEFKLYIKERSLSEITKKLGPSISDKQIKELIYQYDTNCQGYLDFEDFCVFIGDYLLTLNEARQKAKDYYEEMTRKRDMDERSTNDLIKEDCEDEINLFFEHYPELNDYLNSLCLYNHNDILINNIENDEDLTVNDPNILKRKIQVRVYSAINIEQFFRIKYRENIGIEYCSLDPFVRVTLAGESKETTVLIGSTTPIWNQDLTFSITIPPGEIQDIQTWVESQSFYFELFDFNSHGIVSHTELLAAGSIPLSQVLYNTKKSVMINLFMNLFVISPN